MFTGTRNLPSSRQRSRSPRRPPPTWLLASDAAADYAEDALSVCKAFNLTSGEPALEYKAVAAALLPMGVDPKIYSPFLRAPAHIPGTRRESPSPVTLVAMQLAIDLLILGEHLHAGALNSLRDFLELAIASPDINVTLAAGDYLPGNPEWKPHFWDGDSARMRTVLRALLGGTSVVLHVLGIPAKDHPWDPLYLQDAAQW
jgi:hypothetical protein